MSELDELITRYSTPRAQLSPEVRARVAATAKRAEDMKAAGQIEAPHPLFESNASPGLDSSNGYRPFQPINQAG